MEINNYTRRDRQSSMPLLGVNGAESSRPNDPGWSDQELEDFGHDPLEGVLRSVLARPRAISRQQCVTSAVFIAGITLTVGFLVSYLTFFVWYPPLCPQHKHTGLPVSGASRTNAWNSAAGHVDADMIREFLRNISQQYHIAGSERQSELALYIRDLWTKYGLSDVKLVPYLVLLSNADVNKPNRVQVVDKHSGYLSGGVDIVGIVDKIPIFNAYGKAMTVTGDLVYANFGRQEDFLYLTRNLSVSLKDTIVIARYGSVFRGDIVRRAEEYGAIGVILYSDPHEYAADDGKVYPEAYWLPGDGVQNGFVRSNWPNGDPTTYGYPSVDGAYHDEKNMYLPNIPVQPIGYNDATKLLKLMDGPASPQSWVGGIAGINYNVGPGFLHHKTEVKLEVNNINQYANITNVVGAIPGTEEPDRYVIIGNHRDAWIYGAIDPGSGTAVLVEIARVFGLLLKTGWRPRRTILFCSWGAEEYGTIGSYEWVEENLKILQNNAVAYVNVDIAVEGNYTLDGSASPALFDVMFEAAKRVPNPNPEEVAQGRLTVYDTWLYTSTLASPGKKKNTPSARCVGDDSDHSAFNFVAGIPSCDYVYKTNPSTYPAGYPLYHSIYDNFDAVDRLLDPGFKYHVAVAQVMLDTVLQLSESALIPLNVVTYADEIKTAGIAFLAKFGDVLKKQNINPEFFNNALSNFSAAAYAFNSSLATTNINDPLTLRMVNDRLMKLEQAFIMPEGLPLSPFYKHAVISPSKQDLYSGSYFSGLIDLITKIEIGGYPQTDLWDKFRQHLAAVTFYVQSAAQVLNGTIYG